MKRFSVLLVAAAFVFCMAGCGGGDTEESLTIGGLAPLTGGVSRYGIAANNGALLAMEEINAEGGVLGRQVAYIYEDEKGSAEEAAAAYNRLVEDYHIVAQVGDVTTKPTITVAEMAAADGLPMITPTATGAGVTAIGDTIFRACFTDPFQGELLAQYAGETLQAKTAAVLYDAGSDYSVEIAEAFRAEAEQIGLAIVAWEGYATGIIDFDRQLNAIKAAAPDVILAPCYYEDAARITVQAHNLGITAAFLGSDGWDGVYAQVGRSKVHVLDGSYYCSPYPIAAPTEALEEVILRYKQEFDEDVTMFGVLGYEAMHIMCAAIEAAGSTDSAAIVQALQALEYEGVMGTIRFQSGGGTRCATPTSSPLPMGRSRWRPIITTPEPPLIRRKACQYREESTQKK